MAVRPNGRGPCHARHVRLMMSLNCERSVAVFNIGTDTNGAVAQVDGGIWVLDNGDRLTNTVNGFSFNGRDSAALIVRGLVAADFDGVTSSGGSENNDVTISATGTVIGQNDGIEMVGANNSVINNGQISGYGDGGVQVSGPLAHIENHGRIFGLAEAVRVAGSSYVLNTGTLSSGGSQVLVASGWGSTVVNAGQISGQGNGVQFIGVTGQTNTLTNTGVIFSGGAGGVGAAVLGSAGVETVRNTGTLQGDVDLGGGNDLYDGRGGTVTGRVIGGAGDDTYLLSDAGTALVEAAGEGRDAVQIAQSYRLGDNLEDLTLTGSAAADGYGNRQDNAITGNLANNYIKGYAGADVLTGGLGNDTLDGGGGADTLEGGDGVDRVVYAGARAGYSISARTDGSFEITDTNTSDGDEGADLLRGVEFAQFSDMLLDLSALEDPPSTSNSAPAPVALSTGSDFSGDGRDDILWRKSDGQTAIWTMQDGLRSGDARLGTASSEWQIAGVGDFSADGSHDVLWRKSDGQVVVWDMDAGVRAGGTRLGSASSDWKIAGVGDFSGDGSDDILLRKSDGQIVIWDMENGVRSGGTRLGSASSDWKIAGVGDFSGDGSDDILLQKSDGQILVWDMEAGARTGSTDLGSTSSDWAVAGVGDFTGDGSDDVLFRNAGGALSIWDIEGGARAGVINPGEAAAGLEVQGVGDFSGDGSDDILWRGADGQTAIWDMDGGMRSAVTQPGGASSSWEIDFGTINDDFVF